MTKDTCLFGVQYFSKVAFAAFILIFMGEEQAGGLRGGGLNRSIIGVESKRSNNNKGVMVQEKRKQNINK